MLWKPCYDCLLESICSCWLINCYSFPCHVWFVVLVAAAVVVVLGVGVGGVVVVVIVVVVVVVVVVVMVVVSCGHQHDKI